MKFRLVKSLFSNNRELRNCGAYRLLSQHLELWKLFNIIPAHKSKMAPSPLQQRRTHNTLLLQKLLNLRDGASPFTLLLDSLEQSSGSVVREFVRRAKVWRFSHPFSFIYNSLIINAWCFCLLSTIYVYSAIFAHLVDIFLTKHVTFWMNADGKQIGKSKIIFISFSTLRKKVSYEHDVFISTRSKSLSSLRQEIIQQLGNQTQSTSSHPNPCNLTPLSNLLV